MPHVIRSPQPAFATHCASTLLANCVVSPIEIHLHVLSHLHTQNRLTQLSRKHTIYTCNINFIGNKYSKVKNVYCQIFLLPTPGPWLTGASSTQGQKDGSLQGQLCFLKKNDLFLIPTISRACKFAKRLMEMSHKS